MWIDLLNLITYGTSVIFEKSRIKENNNFLKGFFSPGLKKLILVGLKIHPNRSKSIF